MLIASQMNFFLHLADLVVIHTNLSCVGRYSTYLQIEDNNCMVTL
jgi:hypothetical protein